MTTECVDIERWGKMASFASLRQNAWWDLEGAFTLDAPIPIMEFAGKAHLTDPAWNVRKVDLSEYMPEWRFRVPMFAQVRDNPYDGGIDVLATVGKQYGQFQNEELAALAQTFGTGGQYRAETMGSLAGGTKVFMVFVHPDDIVLDPNGGADHIRRYVFLALSHDGTGKVTGRKTNTRVQCRNTWNTAHAGSPADFGCKHTATIADRLAVAAQLAGYVDDYDVKFEADMKLLYSAEMTTSEFWGIVREEFPEPEIDRKGSLAKWTDKTDGIMSVWNNGTGSMPDLPFNAYRALQTFGEVNQWGRQLRNGNAQNALAAGAGFDPVTNGYRQSITDKLLAYVS
jgi:hypothetical protein